MSTFINKLQALKSFIESSKPDFKTSSNNDYINKFMNSHNKDYEKYNKNSMSLVDYYNGIIGKIDRKINVINEQIKNKTTYLHYVDNKISSIQFAHKDESTYHITTLQEVLNNGINTSLNYSEDCYLDESNIFYDIDCEDINKNDALIKLQNEFNSFENIYDELTEFTEAENSELYPCVVGVIEYKDNEKINEFVKSINSNEKFNLILLKLTDKEKYKNNKDFSGHVFINCYGDRDLINKYILSKAIEFDYFEKSAFDSTVYVGKGDRQCLRCSFSGKIKYNEYIRPVHDKMIDIVNDCIDNFKLMSIAPTSESININEFLKQYDYKVKEEVKQTKKQTITKIGEENLEGSDDEIISIFRYIMDENKKLVDVFDYKLNDDMNHYKLSGLLKAYDHMPLSQDELKTEIMNMPIFKSDSLYLCDVNRVKEYKEKLLTKFNYTQDYKNIQPLFTLKKYAYKHLDDYKKVCKVAEMDVDEEVEKQHLQVIESLDYYIRKYKKISFASHSDSFYNIEETRKGTITTKLMYNVYGINNGMYFYPLLKKEYNNITELKNAYSLSGTTLKYVQDNITYFDTCEEYEKYVAKYNYMIYEDKEQLKQDVEDLIKVLSKSFYNINDMYYYLGFLVAKLKSNVTVNKGIINQPKGNESGKDALKTFITDLLDSYLKIRTPDVENINKPLNGAYLKADLVVLQEIPRKIDDIDKFINRCKEYTDCKKIEVEEKGKNSYKRENTIDFIINTNHNLYKLFYNKSDCEALIKRFRIINRKSINVNDKFVSSVLDKFGMEKNTKINKAIHEYALYMYLLNSDKAQEYYKYFEENKRVENEYEEILKAAAVETNETDKITTHETVDKYIENFKIKYMRKNTGGKNGYTKYVKLNDLIEGLMNKVKAYKDVKNQKTIKQQLIANEFISIDGKNYSCTDKQIKMFYDAYYYYEPVEDLENSEDKNMSEDNDKQMEMDDEMDFDE